MTESIEIENDLIEKHGHLIGGVELMSVLGFRTMPAFRKAIRENRVGIEVFKMPGRQGKFALTKDVSNFLEKIRKEKSIREN